MATIERKPLPPPNSTAITITEADRAEMTARANTVIDHYLNGPGSYWDAGTRKPLVSDDELRDGDSTVTDLKKFREGVIASKQFADDPNFILDSIIGLISNAMGEVRNAAQYKEGRNSIQRVPPNPNDPVDDPRVISPRMLNNGALPITLPGEQSEMPPQVGKISSVTNGGPIRILGRRVVSQWPQPEWQGRRMFP